VDIMTYRLTRYRAGYQACGAVLAVFVLAALVLVSGGALAQDADHDVGQDVGQDAEKAEQGALAAGELQKLEQSIPRGVTLGDLLEQNRAQNEALKDKTVQGAVEDALGETVQQERPALPRPAREVFDALRRNYTEREGDLDKGDTVVLRFDDIAGGAALDDQYTTSHNVRFGRGATIQTCRQVRFDTVQSVAPSPCAYPRAASGQNAGHYDLRGGQALRLDLLRAVSSLSVKVNPTGGQLDEAFEMRVAGFDANNNEIASSTLNLIWRQDAFTWPSSISLAAKAGRITRVTMEMRQPRRANQSVRFLFDDLSLTFAPDEPAPLFVALAAQERPPRIASPEVVQSPDDADLQRALRLYPPATRIRTSIDWPAAQRTVADQEILGLRAAPLGDNRAVDMAELPLILPSRADVGTLSVAGQRDSYHADFDRDSRGYSIYGTRVLTSIRPAAGAARPTQNLRFIELEYGFAASFSLYGASYIVTRYCLNDSAEEDPTCYDRDALGDMAQEMAVVIGEAGERAP